LAVITIIGIVLSVTLGSFTGWGDAQAVRGSADVVEAALTQARDYAVSHRVPVSFEYLTGIDPTNGIKKTAEYLLAQESSIVVATNQTRSATDPDPQLLGSTQRLPGNVWLVSQVPLQDAADASDRFVFLPNGKVCNPQTADRLYLYVVSRKMRDTPANTPSIIYRIDIDPASGNATAERYNIP
jgi:Tfp pilus assembly protein FimT